MGRSISYPNQIAKLLLDLSSKFPAVNLGKHIETIICNHGSLEWLSDKELYLILLEYVETIEIEKDLTPLETELETNKIIEDGTHLFDLAENDED